MLYRMKSKESSLVVGQILTDHIQVGFRNAAVYKVLPRHCTHKQNCNFSFVYIVVLAKTVLTKDDYTTNSHYLTYTFLFKKLGGCTF